MKIEKDDFYEDDEGIAADLIIDSFGNQEIQIIYLESSEFDDKLMNDIDFILSNEKKFNDLINSEVICYSEKNYGIKNPNYTLMKIYIFPDIENEFGFLFKFSADREHGLGMRFYKLSVKNIGPAEVSFL